MSFFLGFLGAVAMLAVFGGGCLCGWKLCKYDMSRITKAATDTRSDAEIRRIDNASRAFDALTSYSVEQAYGMDIKLPERGEG